MNIKIRPARANEASEISELCAAPINMIQDSIWLDCVSVAALDSAGAIVGSVVYFSPSNGSRRVIQTVAVKPEYRRKGIAKALLAHVASPHVVRLWADIPTGDEAAEGLFRSCGYVLETCDDQRPSESSRWVKT